jgi:hypothetical protein
MTVNVNDLRLEAIEKRIKSLEGNTTVVQTGLTADRLATLEKRMTSLEGDFQLLRNEMATTSNRALHIERSLLGFREKLDKAFRDLAGMIERLGRPPP